MMRIITCDKGEASTSVWNVGVVKADVLSWIEVAYSKQGIPISQKCSWPFQETGKLGCETSRVPIEQNHKIGSNEKSQQVETSGNTSKTFLIMSSVWLVSSFMIHEKDIYRH